MVILLHILAGNGAVEHVEGGNQGWSSLCRAPFYGQAGRGAVERLNHARFSSRTARWREPADRQEADDVAQFVKELRIVGSLNFASG
ncbi:MAG: hypothetical protein E5V24_04275 [Mesorhizobium sp.]|nr:MAG: hypothetical protein E5V24_04275 [Mesorhizobium sp.]